MGANDDIQDREISHAVYTQRYAAGLSRRAQYVLSETEPAIRSQLAAGLAVLEEEGIQLANIPADKIRQLVKAMERARGASYARMGQQLEAELRSFATYEAAFQGAVLAKVIPGAITVVQATEAVVESLVATTPIQGRLLSEWMVDLKAGDAKGLSREIRIGIAESETTQQIMRRVRGRLKTSRRHANAIIRTAVNHVANQSRNEVAKRNSDIVKSVQWLSTLDGRTSAVCRARDKRVYPVDSGPRPPAHIACRSTITYVLKSWRELGLPNTPSTRASMNGQVAGDVSYGPWLRKQPRSFVLDTLGKKKGQLFLNGDLPIDRFIDRAGGELTLDQLKSRESDAWAKAFN